MQLREQRREKRLIFLGLHRKPKKPQTRDFLCSCRPQVPSRSLEGVKTQSQSGLRSPGKKVNAESLCAPRDQPEKESKREKERKKDTG